MYLKKVISNKTERKKLFVVGILKVTDEKIRSKIRIRFRIRKLRKLVVRIRGDPYKYVTDPQHCFPPTSLFLHFYCLLSQ